MLGSGLISITETRFKKFYRYVAAAVPV